ncbi:MAG TPA: hypothetical protein VFQ79_15355 [Bryobacteraceae bacterium]|nr:hypothetical protein [Bryobacteraceae bacterium]
MQNNGCILAEVPGFGRIYDCGACGNLHLSVGPVSITLTTDAYMQLVALLNTSASNFELWMQAKDIGGSMLDQEHDTPRIEGEP